MVARAPSPRLLAVPLAVLAVLVALLAASLLLLVPQTPGTPVPVTAILSGGGRVRTAVMHEADHTITGTWIAAPRAAPLQFWTAYPDSSQEVASLLDRLSATGASVTVDAQAGLAALRPLAWSALPLLIVADAALLGLGLVRLSRRLPQGEQQRRVFADVAGTDDAVATLGEVARRMQQAARGVRRHHVRGVLIEGPPGCGKTLLAQALAGEAGGPLLSVAAWNALPAEERRVPAVVLAENVDSLSDAALAMTLDTADTAPLGAGAVLVATTAEPAAVPAALRRAERLGLRVRVALPDPAARLAILESLTRGRQLDRSVRLADIALRTTGFAGADLAAVVDAASLIAARGGRTALLSIDLEDAAREVAADPTLRGRILGAEERRRLAVHQAGHAIAAAALGRGRHLTRVSILDHGDWVAPGSGAETRSRSDLLAELTVLCGGTAAEELYFDEPSTLGEPDIAAATALAVSLVGRHGMSAPAGRTRADAPGDDVTREVRALLDDATSAATGRLQRCHQPLVDLVLQLERDEVVEGVALGDLLIRALEVEVAGIATPPPATQPPEPDPAPSRRTRRGTTIAP